MIVFGLDGGIASIGWAVIDDEAGTLAAGVRCFDAPETDKERTPTNALRRQHRGQRRVVRRRRQRMAEVRRLLAAHGLTEGAGREALALAGVDPWEARAAGLERVLNGSELAAALGHIAKHRGFKSNSKRDAGANAADDTSKMKKAIEATRERLGQWRTVGEMFARDPAFAGRKRNVGGDFSRSMLRDDQAREVAALFAAQRRLGNAAANAGLEAAFADAAFFQRPLQDSETLLGNCPFERGEKRTAKRAYNFELFRLLSRLNNVRLATSEGPKPLTPAQVAAVVGDFGRVKKISYAGMRKVLDLAESVRFADVDRADEAKRDVVARSGNAAEGTAVLRDLLGEGVWRSLLDRPAVLDRIAEVITFRDAPENIRAGLAATGVEPVVVERLMEGVAAGAFTAFSGAAHISAKAARAILPGLARGMVYSEACAEAGYNHAEGVVEVEDIRNPTVRRAVGEMLKQVRAMARRYGKPDYIHVELARDVGKGAEERDEISRGIEKRNKLKDKARAEFEELVGAAPSGEELLRYELWKEQRGFCLYSETPILPTQLRASDNSVQVDHILPWSRFGDDSFINKTLCLTSANQAKAGRTPFEWFMAARGPEAWALFQGRVEDCKEMKGAKKRGFYLRQNADEVAERFRTRNLNDTRYATRLLLGLLERSYGVPGERRILARPGALTSKLRRSWGLEGLKKDAEGNRIEDDRHHAVDACVVAATSEALLKRLTLTVQAAERQGLRRDFGVDVPEPFVGFRAAVEAVREGVFVSRSERRRARGQAHDATIRQVREREGKTEVFARRGVLGLTEKMLDEIKDVERNGALRAALKAWLDAGKPKERLPRFPILNAGAQADFDAEVAGAFPGEWREASALVGAERREARRVLRRRFESEHGEVARGLSGGEGPEIRSVLVRIKDKPALMLRGGTAARGEMVRVDVFRETDKQGRGRFHLVPIYVHQVADRAGWPKPPDRAVVAYKEESEWTEVGGFSFMFSLYSNSLVEVVKPDGEVIRGYFRALDRSTAAVSVASPSSASDMRPGIGTKRLLTFRKFAVSRLGEVSEIPSEVRTWHGVACT